MVKEYSMLDIYTVAFFGHKYIDNISKVENLLEFHIKKILCEHEYVDFLVGRNGDFDQSASSSVRRIQKKYRGDNSSLILVLPYLTAEFLNNKKSFESYYSEIKISSTAAKSHPKSAFKIRNCEMIDCADLIICYVKNEHGGAWQAVNYARIQNKQIINLAEA